MERRNMKTVFDALREGTKRYFTNGELAKVGMTEPLIQYHARVGNLSRVRHGLYMLTDGYTFNRYNLYMIRKLSKTYDWSYYGFTSLRYYGLLNYDPYFLYVKYFHGSLEPTLWLTPHGLTKRCISFSTDEEPFEYDPDGPRVGNYGLFHVSSPFTALLEVANELPAPELLNMFYKAEFLYPEWKNTYSYFDLLDYVTPLRGLVEPSDVAS